MKTLEEKAKEKANELVEKFTFINGNSFFAKDCAILTVDEIIKANPYSAVMNSTIKFWQEVKNELQKL